MNREAVKIVAAVILDCKTAGFFFSKIVNSPVSKARSADRHPSEGAFAKNTAVLQSTVMLVVPT